MDRYSNIQLYRRGNEPVRYGTWDLPEKLKVLSHINWFGDQTPVSHIWKYGDRLDRIAHKHYSDDTMWWIIAVANNITNPLDITIGKEILIPVDYNSVLEQLNMR
jgi:hypothetical protein